MLKKDIKKKILIIEDDTTLRDNISDFLLSEGFFIDAASDGMIGLEKIKKFLPDLVLCDIALPKMNGFELLKKIREDDILKDIPFIFLTAMVGMDDFKTGMKLGAEDYITKPFDFDKLITTIKSRIKKQIEYRLSTEKKFRSLIENSLTGVFILKSEKFIYTNPKFREIFKYDDDEIIELNKIIHRDYLTTLSNYIIECLADKIKDINIELKGIRKDGKDLYIQLFAGKTIYENKPAILGNVLDITIRKKAEENIRKSEKRYRELLGMVPAGIIELDTNGCIQYINCEFLNLTGYKLTDVLKKNIIDLIPRNSVLNEINQFLEKALKNEIQPTPLYLELIRKNYSIIETEARWNYLKDIEGNITGLILSLVDITEREKGRIELLKSQERLHSVMQISSEFIWELDNTGTYTFVNEKVFDILNYTTDEIIGKSKYELVSTQDKENVKKYLDDIYINGKPFITFKAKFLNKNEEEILLENKCIPIYDQSGKIKGIRGASRQESDLKSLKWDFTNFKQILELISSETNNLIIFKFNNEDEFLINNNFLRHTNQSFEEKKDFILDLIHPEDKNEYLAKLKEWESSINKSLKQLYRCKSINGKYTLIEDIRIKIKDDNHNLFTIILLKEIPLKKDIIFDNIPIGIILTDYDGNIVYANQKINEITRKSNDKILNCNYSDILNNIGTFDNTAIQTAIQEEGTFEFEIISSDINKSRYKAKISEIKDKNGEFSSLLITLQDLDQEKDKDESNNRLIEKFKNFITLELKFISKLNHNVRSPINTIIGYTEILKEEIEDEKLNLICDKILGSALKISDTLEKSLKMIQLKTIEDNLNFKKTDLIKVIEKNLDLFKSEFYKKNLLINIDKANKNIFINADEILINQLFYTIFENFTEQTKEGNITLTINTNNSPDQNIVIIQITISNILFCKTLKKVIELKNIKENPNISLDIDKVLLDFTLIEKIIKIHNATIGCECINNEYSVLTIVFPLSV